MLQETLVENVGTSHVGTVDIGSTRKPSRKERIRVHRPNPKCTEEDNKLIEVYIQKVLLPSLDDVNARDAANFFAKYKEVPLHLEIEVVGAGQIILRLCGLKLPIPRENWIAGGFREVRSFRWEMNVGLLPPEEKLTCALKQAMLLVGMPLVSLSLSKIPAGRAKNAMRAWAGGGGDEY